MKKLIALVAGLFILMPAFACAASFSNASSVSINEKFSNLYIANSNVSIDGNVGGDLNAAGRTVNVSGKVENSANIAGGTVEFSGEAGNNLRIAGGTVIVSGTVGQDLILAGGQVTLDSKSEVKGDVIIFGGTINLNGKIDGKVVGSGGKITINGPVGGNVELKNVGTLTLDPKAVISGDLIYGSRNKAVVSGDASVKGQTKFTQLQSDQTVSTVNAGFGLIMGLIGGFLLLFLVTFLFPKSSKEIVEKSFGSVWANLGIGFAVLVATPVAALLLLLTFVGVPIAGLVFLAYIAVIVLAGIYSALILGSWLKKVITKSREYQIDWAAVLIGVLAMGLLKIVPVIGWILAFGFFLVTLGTVSNMALSYIKNQKK